MRSVSIPVTGSRIFNRVSFLGKNARHDDFIIGESRITKWKSVRKFISFVIEHYVGMVDPSIDNANLDPLSGKCFTTAELPCQRRIH